jgi:hypothetical protein
MEIQQTITKLKSEFPISSERRLEHILKRFEKKLGPLKTIDKNYIIKNVFIDKDVTLQIINLKKDTVANAVVTDNVIQLDISKVSELEKYESGYSKEHKYMTNIKTKDDYIKWVVVHEYCHLLNPDLKHTNEFFSQVKMMYDKIN